jgi:quinol monooxygenase YgiN
MITMTIIVKVRPEKREEFLQAMRSLSSDREKQEGLRKSTLYQEIDDETGFCLMYEWETQEVLERYLGGEKFRVLLGALEVLCEKSEIKCREISEKLSDLARGAYEQ